MPCGNVVGGHGHIGIGGTRHSGNPGAGWPGCTMCTVVPPVPFQLWLMPVCTVRLKVGTSFLPWLHVRHTENEAAGEQLPEPGSDSVGLGSMLR